ncbi:MAG: hypothetical protein JNM80_00485 [Phycisphaerae bacterium]|nr:hypothetical protein [Phycisphaerae bacterium]
MPIVPLPQFEADLEADRKAYEALKPPTSIVVRFGDLKLVGEFAYSGDAKPGCGSKVVVRTFRGTELGEMLTTTCPNSGCSKSVSRQEMLRYIDNSGGRDYPFFTDGRVLRVATREDLDKQASLEQSRHGMKMAARAVVERLGLKIKIVDAEPILGGERVTIYYNSEDRPDLRDAARDLGAALHQRVEFRLVGARDEARLTADYERCGQYCCCKNFLKVLKPISMRAAKMQKATLDPLKISGRCGRLMCCLRYEDQTYEELRKKLPKRKTRVGTPEGNGLVIDSQILTQLVLVQLEGSERQVAVAVEDLTEPTSATPPPVPVAGSMPAPERRDPRPRDGGGGRGDRPQGERREGQPRREGERRDGERRDGPSKGGPPREGDVRGPRSSGGPRPPAEARPAQGRPMPERPTAEDLDAMIESDYGDTHGPTDAAPQGSGASEGGPRRRRRRRRRRPGGGGPGGGPPGGESGGAPPGGPASPRGPA